MKSVFISFFVIVTLAIQFVSAAAPPVFEEYKFSDNPTQQNADTHSATAVHCFAQEQDKKPVTSKCKIDSKFFPVTMTVDFPQTITEHTQSNPFWIAARPTQHAFRPPIS